MLQFGAEMLFVSMTLSPPTQAGNQSAEGGREQTAGSGHTQGQIPPLPAGCGELCVALWGWGPRAHLSTAEAATELRPLTITVASGRRFGGIATHVRWSFATHAHLAAEPNFGAVSPTPWAGRA